MIPLSDISWQAQSWQWLLAHTVNTEADLRRLLSLAPTATDVPTDFPLRVPLPYVSRMIAGDPDDPLLRQALPVAAELDEVPGFTPDPLRELEFADDDGTMSKYNGRMLIVTTGACAINCRYCFRRSFPYAEHQPDKAAWDAIIARIAADSSIHEIILSGGDPLVLNDQHLARVVGALDQIPHLTTLRIHTRLPVVIPQRVCPALLDWATNTRLRVVAVIHANHANELDNQVGESLARLAASGVTLLNQSVLLRGVNDSVPALAALSERLFAVGVLPYYLHMLDKVAGAAHFDTGETAARHLIGELRAELPGYLVPRLAREVPGARNKTIIA